MVCCSEVNAENLWKSGVGYCRFNWKKFCLMLLIAATEHKHLGPIPLWSEPLVPTTVKYLFHWRENQHAVSFCADKYHYNEASPRPKPSQFPLFPIFTGTKGLSSLQQSKSGTWQWKINVQCTNTQSVIATTRIGPSRVGIISPLIRLILLLDKSNAQQHLAWNIPSLQAADGAHRHHPPPSYQGHSCLCQ